MELTETLDLIENLESERENILNFRFDKDRQHDYSLIDWFCNNGNMRIYKKDKTYMVYLVSGNGLKLWLGTIFENFETRGQNAQWQNYYIAYAWKKLKTFTYCTNNQLKSPEEVGKYFGNDETYKYMNSQETKETITKNKKEVETLLNNLNNKY
ncbi:MAG: hypothetical protein ACOC22_03035 [bacterium]